MKSSVAAVLLLAVAGMQLAAGESFRAASQYPITERLQGSPRSSVQQPVATSSWYKA